MMNLEITLARNPNVAYKISKAKDVSPQVASLGEAWLAAAKTK